VAEPDAPSYAQLLALVEQLQAENAKLVERVTELEARLAQNSSNSSRPPSSDGLAKPAPKSRRGRSGRKPGGQPGHPGRTLEQVEAPDEVPAACGGCGAALAGAAQTGLVRRQVFDIPATPVRVVEHQLVIEAGRVPYLDGARESLAAGYVSGGTRRNLAWVRPHLDPGGTDEDELLLLADAQTSGGLLVAAEVPGYPVVGELVPARLDGVTLVVR
jgi:hypothetical protein